MNIDKHTICRAVFSAATATVGSGDRRVGAYLSAATPDRMDDEIEQGGIDFTNFLKSPTVLANHNSDAPIARAVSVGMKDGRLYSVAEFPPEGTSTTSDEWYRLIRAGVINSVSIGFRPLEWEPKKGGGIKFKRVELYEYSYVSVAAMPDALIVQRSATARAHKGDNARARAKAQLFLINNRARQREIEKCRAARAAWAALTPNEQARARAKARATLFRLQHGG